MTPEDALDRGLEALELALPDGGRSKLLGYVALLLKWNRTYNLTAIRDPREVITHHLLDCLAASPHLRLSAASSLADVGSGGGLPGIPLAIARPDVRVTLNDSNDKKCAFLRQAVIELELPNVNVHQGRAEHWTPHNRYSTAISRAFSSLADFIAACRHLVLPGGVLASMKGVFPAAELRQAGKLCLCDTVIALKVPYLDAERHLVLCTVAP